MAYVETRVSIEHDGLMWLGEWIHYPPYIGHDGKVAPNHYLVVSQMVNDVPVPVSDLIGVSRRQTMDVSILLAKKRMENVRSELMPVGNEDINSVADAILEKLQSGEWLGQITHNQDFTVYEFAFLLGTTDREAYELALNLQKDGRITMSDGDIINLTMKEEE